jgi:putative ABC transport system ATP-binding protein
MIELKNIEKIYKMGKFDVIALKEVSLKIMAGDFIALVGPSGSGKTTLLNIIGCLDTPTSGEILIDNDNITKARQKKLVKIRRDKIGFIFQNFNLIPVLSVYENVEYPLLLTKTKAAKRHESVMAVLEEVGLTQRVKHMVNDLSGGERQRVAIARALVKKPSVILADEPTANLDSTTGLNIIELMKSLNKHEHVTFIFSTHDEKIMKNADKILQIRDGVISA